MSDDEYGFSPMERMRQERDAAIAERDRLRAQVADLLPEAEASQHFATRALRAEDRLDRLRRELEALRDDLRGDADDSRAGMDHDHAAELDDIARSLDAILRGES